MGRTGSHQKINPASPKQTIPNVLRQTALRGLFCFGLLAAAAPVPAIIRELFMPGIHAEVWTGRGEAMALDGIRLTTPPDFRTAPAGEPMARFSADTALPGGEKFFGNIQRMVLNEAAPVILGSNPREMEYYRLGDPRSIVPPPPDWKHTIGQIPPWHRAEAVTDVAGLPWLGHALYCWNGRASESGKDLGIYLFRQSFRLGRPGDAARATLRLAIGADLIEAAFNEYPLHLAGGRKPGLAEFEVTPLLREGDNIVALKVRGRPELPGAGGALAFELEIAQCKAGGTPLPPRDPGAALLIGRGGDRAWGAVDDLRADRILLTTPYGPYTMDWDECDALLFPGGWRAPRPPQGLREKFFPGSARPTLPDLKMNALPVTMLPGALRECLLLTEGRVTTAKPGYAGGGKIYLDGAEGRQIQLSMADVLGIYPPRPVREMPRRPPRQLAFLMSQVATRSGDVFGGLLRQISPEAVVIETGGGQMMRIPTERVTTIEFPWHAATLSPGEALKGAIAVLPQAGADAKAKPAYDADALAVQKAAYRIGADTRVLTVSEEAGATTLRPESMPVVVAVDPEGAYLRTRDSDGDAEAALLKYVEGGGVVIALSRGGALRKPMDAASAVLPTKTAPALAERLGLKTLKPGAAEATGAEAFKRPPASGGNFIFQRGAQIPEGLSSLPKRIELAPRLAAPFTPMVSENGPTLVYALTDQRGKSYGPALTLVSKGRGWVMIVDELLWESRVDARPFTERVLPQLLHWALMSAGH